MPVGRVVERAFVEVVVSEVAGRAPRVLVVRGETGIGKSRLLDETVVSARAAGFRVLTGRAGEFEGDVPYGAVSAVLAALPHRPVARRPRGPARAVPVLDRLRVHRGVRAALEVAAADRPVLLVVDDLHWADADTLELVEHLLRRPPAAVLVALALPSGPVPPALQRCLAAAARSGTAATVELGPLTADGSAALLAARGADPALRERLQADGGGNPLLLTQLARHPARHSGSGLDAVAAAMTAELRELPEPARLLLAGAALAGDPFDADLARTAAALSADAAGAALRRLRHDDLVRPAGTELAFRHPVLRAVAHGGVAAPWRAQAHARIAAALRTRGGPADRLAHHLRAAAADGGAPDLGAVAAAVGRAPTTADRPDTALRLPPATTAPRRGSAETTAVALQAAGRLAEAREVYRAALAGADEDDRVRLAVAFAGVQWRLGDRPEAVRLLAGTRSTLDDPRGEGAVRLQLAAAALHLWVGDAEQARRLADHARADARTAGLRAAGDALHAGADVWGGRPGRARDAAREAAAVLDAAATAGGPDLAAHLEVLVVLGWAESALERPGPGSRHLERAVSLATATGRTHLLPDARYALADTLTWTGELTRAARVGDDAVEVARLTGVADSLLWALRTRCATAVTAGDLPAALRLGEEARALAVPHRTPATAATAARRAEAWIAAGEPTAGAVAVQVVAGGPDLPRIPPVERPYWFAVLTDAELGRARLRAAADWADRAGAAAGALGLGGRTGLALRARAAVEHARGRHSAAADTALHSAALLTAAGNPVEAARSASLAGAALAGSGRRAAAVRHLTVAVADLTRCGARQHRAQALARLRRAGGPATGSRNGGPA